ncbi:glycerate kinase [Microlunatus ginsengisoli]|uniref:Glycerate kinase n=1 Tax=Microlunatus ginsengisoli TaxID=363863 RepID=A0ABP6ZA16_9ACTN
MRVVIAPDKFKGSVEAPQVAEAIADGLAAALPTAEVHCQPVADGGEGTVAAALAGGYRAVTVTVTGPVGDPVEATFAVDGTRAVIEMAAASGLLVLPIDDAGEPVKDALGATSQGTGELIAAALDHGCTEIVLGVGGSANTDGGAGLLVGLGARLLDDAGDPVAAGGGGLARLASVDVTGLDPRIAGASFTLAADVTNPLLGPHGAAAVFGPQKGATDADVATLDANLELFRDRLADALGPAAAKAADAPGAGAAGGVGYAALAVLDAERRPGVDVVLELVGLADRLTGVDLVITGEGSLDGQSLGGKTPVGVAALARAHGVPTVIGVCGRSLLTEDETRKAGFDEVIALLDRQPDSARAMAEAAALLTEIGGELGRRYASIAT